MQAVRQEPVWIVEQPGQQWRSLGPSTLSRLRCLLPVRALTLFPGRLSASSTLYRFLRGLHICTEPCSCETPRMLGCLQHSHSHSLTRNCTPCPCLLGMRYRDCTAPSEPHMPLWALFPALQLLQRGVTLRREPPQSPCLGALRCAKAHIGGGGSLFFSALDVCLCLSLHACS